ncbi:unnamed protein product, partial [Amoebophrya sp. A25]
AFEQVVLGSIKNMEFESTSENGAGTSEKPKSISMEQLVTQVVQDSIQDTSKHDIAKGRYMRMLCASYSQIFKMEDTRRFLPDAAVWQQNCQTYAGKPKSADALENFFEVELPPWMALLIECARQTFKFPPRYNQALTVLLLAEGALASDVIKDKIWEAENKQGGNDSPQAWRKSLDLAGGARRVTMAQVPTGQGKTIIAGLLAMMLTF